MDVSLVFYSRAEIEIKKNGLKVIDNGSHDCRIALSTERGSAIAQKTSNNYVPDTELKNVWEMTKTGNGRAGELPSRAIKKCRYCFIQPPMDVWSTKLAWASFNETQLQGCEIASPRLYGTCMSLSS